MERDNEESPDPNIYFNRGNAHLTRCTDLIEIEAELINEEEESRGGTRGNAENGKGKAKIGKRSTENGKSTKGKQSGRSARFRGGSHKRGRRALHKGVMGQKITFRKKKKKKKKGRKGDGCAEEHRRNNGKSGCNNESDDEEDTPRQHMDHALNDFSKAVELAPEVAKYHHSLGLAKQVQEGQDAEALRHFTEAIEIDGDHIPSHFHMGLMLHRLERLPEALEAYEKVISYVDDDELIYESRGLVYQDQGDHVRAVDDFSKAIALEEDNGENYYHRGESMLRLREFHKAVDDFETALKIGYERASVYVSYSLTL